MVYLYIGRNTIKLLSLSKTLLGQFGISHFSKTHSTDFITKDKLTGIDIVASSLKEALTSAKPTAVTEKEVQLILPQEYFHFGRYNVPSDVSENAVLPFIKDKVRSDLGLNIESEQCDFIVQKQGNEDTILFYAIKKPMLEDIAQVLQLLQLKLSRIIPESLAYYKLFEKTLRKEKVERILYVAYNDDHSFGYLYDSTGLLKKEKYTFDSDIKPVLKKKVDELSKEDIKVNRLILSGSESTKVRQDLFTKDVGAWTNPLEKIIDNFYKDYLKLLVPNESVSFPVLELDVCFGAFIFTQENSDFSMLKSFSGNNKSINVSMPKISLGPLGHILNLKTLAIFAVSFVLSFGIIFGLSNMDIGSFKFELPSFNTSQDQNEANQSDEQADKETEASPTPEPSPTPSITREDLKVKILNGSGIPGKASDVQDILQEEGYTDIVTGNADSFDYETSEIQVKEDTADAFNLLTEDLADYVEVEKTDELDEDDAADVVIIVGTDFE